MATRSAARNVESLDRYRVANVKNSGDVSSVHAGVSDVYLPCARTEAPLEVSPQGNGTFIYSLNMNFHFFMGAKFCGELPRVTVRPEYADEVRVAWSHYPAVAIIESLTLFTEREEGMTLDCTSILASTAITKTDKDGWNEQTCNVPSLTSWSTHLPKSPFNFNIPFNFSKTVNSCIPLMACRNMSLKIKAKLRLSVRDLLRIEQRDSTGKWTPCALSSRLVEISRDAIDIPVIAGTYSTATEAEIAMWNKSLNDQEYILPLTQWKAIEVPDRHGLSKEVGPIKISYSQPVRYMFWAAQNLEAVRRHEHTNFTTNPDDQTKGTNPCKHVTCKNGTVVNFEGPHYMFDRNHNFTTSPYVDQKGFNFHLFCHNPNISSTDAAIIPDDNEMTFRITLGNTEDEGDDDSEWQYRVVLYIECMCEMVFNGREVIMKME